MLTSVDEEQVEVSNSALAREARSSISSTNARRSNHDGRPLQGSCCADPSRLRATPHQNARAPIEEHSPSQPHAARAADNHQPFYLVLFFMCIFLVRLGALLILNCLV